MFWVRDKSNWNNFVSSKALKQAKTISKCQSPLAKAADGELILKWCHISHIQWCFVGYSQQTASILFFSRESKSSKHGPTTTECFQRRRF
jgi:hypothetical protein